MLAIFYMQHERPVISEKNVCIAAKDWLDYLNWCKELEYDLQQYVLLFSEEFQEST